MSPGGFGQVRAGSGPCELGQVRAGSHGTLIEPARNSSVTRGCPTCWPLCISTCWPLCISSRPMEMAIWSSNREIWESRKQSDREHTVSRTLQRTFQGVRDRPLLCLCVYTSALTGSNASTVSLDPPTIN